MNESINQSKSINNKHCTLNRYKYPWIITIDFI